jgi:hypothetical protein
MGVSKRALIALIFVLAQAFDLSAQGSCGCNERVSYIVAKLSTPSRCMAVKTNFVPKTQTVVTVGYCGLKTPCVKIRPSLFRKKAFYVTIFPGAMPLGGFTTYKVKAGKRYLEETYNEPMTFLVVGKKAKAL